MVLATSGSDPVEVETVCGVTGVTGVEVIGVIGAAGWLPCLSWW